MEYATSGPLAAAGDPFSRRRALAIALALVVVGLVVRVPFFDDYRFEGLVCDGAAYMNVAENLASGRGWVTDSLRFLFLLPPSMPQPDAHWSPLYPLLTSWSFAVFGATFGAAKLVPLVFGVLVPAAIFLFVASLARSWKAGVVAGVLAIFHPTLVTWSFAVMTEIVSIFFVALTLFLLMSPRTTSRPYWVGAALGLAYLTKYQSVLLWVAVIAFYLLNAPARTALRRLGVAAAVFLAVISPWLVRNAIVFGDPFYSDLRYNLISYYPEFGSEARYLSSLEMPASAMSYMSGHVATVLAYLKGNLLVLARGFMRENAGSIILIPLALMALPDVVRDWRRWVPVLLFAAALAASVAVTIAQVRYLHVLLPLWLALAACGAGRLLAFPRGRWAPAWRAGVAALVLVAAADLTRAAVVLARDTSGQWTPSANFCALEAASAAGFVREHTAASDAVFAPETFHYALLFDRTAVQIPFDEGDVQTVGRRYGIRYLVISTRDLAKRLPSWVDNAPAWASMVWRLPADDVPRPAANPAYAFVSEMRVYELNLNTNAN